MAITASSSSSLERTPSEDSSEVGSVARDVSYASLLSRRQDGIALVEGKAVCGEESGNPEDAPGGVRGNESYRCALGAAVALLPPGRDRLVCMRANRNVPRTLRSAQEAVSPSNVRFLCTAARADSDMSEGMAKPDGRTRPRC